MKSSVFFVIYAFFAVEARLVLCIRVIRVVCGGQTKQKLGKQKAESKWRRTDHGPCPSVFIRVHSCAFVVEWHFGAKKLQTAKYAKYANGKTLLGNQGSLLRAAGGERAGTVRQIE